MAGGLLLALPRAWEYHGATSLLRETVPMTPKQPTPQTPPKPEPFDTANPGQWITPSAPGTPQLALQIQAGARPLPEYELVRKLGEGGFGQAWLALGPGGFKVALKFVKLGESASVTELKALEAIKDFRHAHLLAVFGVWQKDGQLIIAMELADRSLLDRLKEVVAQKLPGIPQDELWEYLREAAKGLDFLNDRGIVHRDIKPHNLFLSGDTVKIADYGLAKVQERTMATASTKMTPAYSAPEFFNGQASKWSDQYCLAVTYCHLRANQLPFQGGVQQMIAGHLMKEPDLSMLPEAERPIVARALAKDPKERWPNCKAYVEALVATRTPDSAALHPRLNNAGQPAVSSPDHPVKPRMLHSGIPDNRGDTPHISPTDELWLPPIPKPAQRSRVGLLLLLFLLLGAGSGALLLLGMRGDLSFAWLSPSTDTSTKLEGWATPTEGTKKAPSDTIPASTPTKPVENRPTPPETKPTESKPVDAKLSLTPTKLAETKPAPPPQPLLTLAPLPTLTFKAGERRTLTIRIQRQNFTGPVELKFANIPAGLSLPPSFIPSGQDVADVEVSASPEAKEGQHTIHLLASAKGLEREADLRLRVERPVVVEKTGTKFKNSVGMTFTYIPAGEFLMGSPSDEKDRREDEHQHQVRLTRPFYLGVMEVTRGQFRQFVEATGYKTEAERDGKGGIGWNAGKNNWEKNSEYTWTNPGFAQTDEHPVVIMSWNDAQAFCQWLSQKENKIYRLPTEAEWEYTCRAGTTSRFITGDDEEDLAKVGNVADATFRAKTSCTWGIKADDGYTFTAPVGQYMPNAWGLYDMHGNVGEWCQDGYDKEYYQKESGTVIDPINEQKSTGHVTRGGTWLLFAYFCRSADRNGGESDSPNFTYGFRVACNPSKSP